MKKVCSLLLLLALLITAIPSHSSAAVGRMPQPKYSGIAASNLFIRTERSREADTVGHYTSGSKVLIVSYDPEWLTVVKGGENDWVTGYVLRHVVTDIKKLEGTRLPFGATPAAFVGTMIKDTELHSEPDEESDTFFTLTEGAKVAIIEMKDGWAKVIYWRMYGYFYMGNVKDVTPVYDAEAAQSGDLIAAFMSFYKLTDDEMNQNRIVNIKTACDYIAIVLEPGAKFSFDETAGPYQGPRGYLEGWSALNGETVPSYGGGVCQVSSTLYNVLLALPEGITILLRRAHGPEGATYLPHGVDAAVGNAELNLLFQNDYSFPIQIETMAQDGALYIAFRKI